MVNDPSLMVIRDALKKVPEGVLFDIANVRWDGRKEGR